jgi:hypothetical protein
VTLFNAVSKQKKTIEKEEVAIPAFTPLRMMIHN